MDFIQGREGAIRVCSSDEASNRLSPEDEVSTIWQVGCVDTAGGDGGPSGGMLGSGEEAWRFCGSNTTSVSTPCVSQNTAKSEWSAALKSSSLIVAAFPIIRGVGLIDLVSLSLVNSSASLSRILIMGSALTSCFRIGRAEGS